jgi:hypothetical protein
VSVAELWREDYVKKKIYTRKCCEVFVFNQGKEVISKSIGERAN